MKDRCLPYIVRMYDKLHANDVWIADNHTLDIQSYDGNGTVHRLYLTAFLDAKSGVPVGWNITDTVNSQSTILALRHGIMRFGLPKTVYFDNGREFLVHDIGGKGHRTRKSDEDSIHVGEYVKTSISGNVYAIIRNCHLKGGLAIACGDAGIGKTQAAKQYAKDYGSSCIYITANPCIKSPKSVLKLLGAQFNITANSLDDLWLTI